MMPVVILCGGWGARINSIYGDLPKSLVPILGVPFLTHQLRLLRSKGFERFYLCLGHGGDEILAGYGCEKVRGFFDGPCMLGTGGAIKKILPHIEKQFFVIYGDSYLDFDYGAAQERFLSSKKLSLMTIYKNDNQYDKSNVEFCDGRIVAYDKNNRTDAMRHIDYGCGIFSARAFEGFEGQFDLSAVYQKMLEENNVEPYEIFSRFHEIGSLEGIRELCSHLSTCEK